MWGCSHAPRLTTAQVGWLRSSLTPANLHCLRENLAGEIAEGKVTLIEAGVWDTRTKLTLWQPEGDLSSLANSFVLQFKEGVEGVPVMPLDDIVSKLNLERVDFIKMDLVAWIIPKNVLSLVFQRWG